MHERFKKIRNQLNLTQTELGEKLGKKLRTIQNYESGDFSIPFNIINKLHTDFNINPDWLLFGKGTIFAEVEADRFLHLRTRLLDKAQYKLAEELGEPLYIIQDIEDKKIDIPADIYFKLQDIYQVNLEWLRKGEGEPFQQQYIINTVEYEGKPLNKIAYYSNVSASAGGGATVDMENAEEIYISDEFIKISKNLACINVVGDSMEPALYDKDKVVIDMSIIDVDNIVKGNIYIIRKDNELYIKRYAGNINGAYIFSSDNIKYDSVVLQDESCKVIGKLVGFYREVNK